MRETIFHKMNPVPQGNAILEVVYNKDISDVFKRISARDSKSEVIINQLRITRKQYYSRIQRLLSASLIRRYKGRYLLTTLGRVIYKAHANFEENIETALRNHQKLKAIDFLGVPSKHQLNELISELIHDQEIKSILMKDEQLLLRSTIVNSKGNRT